VRGALTLAALLAFPCRLFAALCGIALFVLAGVIVYDVVGRNYFDTNSVMLQELQWHLHGAIAVLAFGYAYLKDAHVRIDVFAGRFEKRFRLRLEIAVILLFLVPFMIAVAWYGADFAWRSFDRGEGSPGGMGLPHRFVIKSAVPLSAVLAILGGLSVALRAWVALKRPDLLADPFERSGQPTIEAGSHG
jgi:TRAP-type mannitol/chloroaromatic compound transport system permease small subunit